MSKVAEKIILEAEKEAARIAADAEQEHLELAEKQQHEAAELRLSLDEMVKEDHETAWSRERSRIDIEHRKQELAFRHDILAQMKEQLALRLKEDSHLLQRIYQQAMATGLQTGKEELLCAREDRAHVDAALASSSVKPARIEATLSVRGLQIEGQGISTRVIIDELVEDVFENDEVDIARLLFGERE